MDGDGDEGERDKECQYHTNIPIDWLNNSNNTATIIIITDRCDWIDLTGGLTGEMTGGRGNLFGDLTGDLTGNLSGVMTK